jgi:glycosyltransferase involved in cell wall biosynthesis
MPRRLLTISHSYVVALNRAVPNAIAALGWDVTAVAPPFFRADLRAMSLEPREGEHVHLELVPIRRSSKPPIRYWGRRLRHVLSQPWDIVHVWEEPYVTAGAQVAWWHQRGALVYATFQNISKRYPPPFGWIERYAMRRANGWVAFGETVESTLESRPGYASVPHRVIPPGLDLTHFRDDGEDRAAMRAELGLGPGDVVVGYAGRFVREKGLPTLTAALDACDGPWRALLVGGGPLEPDLRRWADRHGARARVLTGVSHARMARFLRAMDVLALPSRTTPRWREQFGRVLVEAMACGVPVIGSDSGEIPYVIGDAGLVVPEGDVRRWVDAIGSILREHGLRDRLRARGRARAHQFSVASSAAAHVEFFEELLAP